MIEKRILENKDLDKTFIIEKEDTKVKYQTVKNGKGRVFSKDFNSEEDAFDFFNKKQWEMLKKDYVFIDKNKSFGKPVLHRFVSKFYTGCLSFENTEKGIYVYNPGDYDSQDKEYDYLLLINKNAEVIENIQMPEALSWDIKYSNKHKKCFLDLDHHIYTLNTEDNTFEKISDRGNGDWGSYVFVSDKVFSYATNNKLIIKDYAENLLLEREYTIKKDDWKTPFCATISNNAKLLALHTEINKVDIIDIKTNKIIKTVKSDFDMLRKMVFSENDKTLILKKYNNNHLIYIDIDKNEEKKYKELDIPEYIKDVNDFCLNQDESILVLLQSNKAYVYDFVKKEYKGSFKIENIVKRAHIKFIDDKLAVRTDYGCFSIYNV